MTASLAVPFERSAPGVPPRAVEAPAARRVSAVPRLRRIVVGVDLRAPSIAASAWCARHLAPGAELILVHSCGEAGSGAAAGARQRAEGRLRTLRETLSPTPVRIVIGEGDPAACIADVAAAADADLVVVGAHAAAPGPWGRFGTTAERLVRRSPVPVLLATGSLDHAPRRLLVPVSGDVPESVVDWACMLEERFDAGIAIVHLAPPDGPDGAAPNETGTRGERRWRKLAVASGSGQVFIDSVSGEPGASVVAEAARFRADVVVLDVVTLRDLHRARVGIGAVLRRTPCAVLVVADRPTR